MNSDTKMETDVDEGFVEVLPFLPPYLGAKEGQGSLWFATFVDSNLALIYSL